MRSLLCPLGCSLLLSCSDSAPEHSADASVRDAMIDAARPAQDAGKDSTTPADASALDAASIDAAVVDAAVAIDPKVEAMHALADELLETLMLRFWSSLAANTNTYDWMYAHYWDAVLDAAERRGPNAFAGSARMFFELQQKRGWLDGFYDDENWVTLALLHAYEVTNEAIYLDQAKIVFADIEKAWDETCCGEHKGGLWWKKPTENKVTAINAGAVISAARLYRDTHDEAYLTFAKKVYDHWAMNMVDAQTGHVYDGIDNAGVINKSWRFTYNEGLFIGAIVELSRVTNDNSRLPLAHKVAAFMLKEESAKTPLGTILSDGKCSGDGEMFKAVGARYLGELYAFDPTHDEYRDFLERSANAAYMYARDSSTGLVSCDWAGPFDMMNARVGSLGSAAVGAAAAAKAMGASEPRPALAYEAEEGNLHGIGVEAKYTGFSGWGYVAGWGANGQSLDLLIDVEQAGMYAVEWRYAASDDATRMLSVNGAAATTLQFASTGDYANYASMNTSVALERGRNTLSVRYTSGYLNLDLVTLSPR